MLSAKEQFFLGTTHSNTIVPRLGVDLDISQTVQSTGSDCQQQRAQPVANGQALRFTQTTSEPNESSVKRPLMNSNSHSPPTSPQSEADAAQQIGLSNLPTHQPIDMEFKNLSLTVKLGFRRGSSCLLIFYWFLIVIIDTLIHTKQFITSFPFDFSFIHSFISVDHLSFD